MAIINSIPMYNIINYLKTNLGKTDITLNSGASDELNEKTEKFFNITLPDDIKQFYRFSDGFESEEYIFRIIPLDEIIDNAIRWNDHGLYIAEYLIYAETWSLEINADDCNNYHINSLYEKDEPNIVLTKSFSEFLNRFLNGGLFRDGGLYDWHDERRVAEGLPSRNPKI